jgi:hypothetical protein
VSGRSTSFEIQVLRDKRWVTTDVLEDADQAVQFADNLAGKGNLEAVRVVRDFARLDGLHSENVIHEKTGTGGPAVAINISPVTDAPMCNEIGDFYALPARMVAGRLLRKYLDEVVLTPTELFHHAREMKRLADKDRLLMSAVDSVAGLQAPGGGAEGKARRDLLHKTWDQMVARAQQAAPPKLTPKATFKELSAASAKATEPRFACTVNMVTQLVEIRSWVGKLDRLLAWAAEDETSPGMALIDGVIADLMQPAEAIQDVLGYQANLAAALCQICDLIEGKAEPAKFAHAAFSALNRLFAENKLPEARESLLWRVVREIRGANPLSRNEPGQELECFVRLLTRLVGRQGVIGGAHMAEALVQRSIRFQTMGGASGLARAVDAIVIQLGDSCRKTIFFLDLAPIAPEITGSGPTVMQWLKTLAQAGRDIDHWVPRRFPPRERMLALTDCNKAVRENRVIEDEVRSALSTCTDETLASYLEKEEVIEKIDKPDDPLAFRALRLVKFLGSGVLIPGKSRDMAKQRILAHLRQPHFEEKFLASLPDKEQAEKHLRDFHRLLTESGFGN